MSLQVTASTVVPAPPEQVFELLCDTARYPEWVTATNAVPRTDGPARGGSSYDESKPDPRPLEGEHDVAGGRPQAAAPDSPRDR